MTHKFLPPVLLAVAITYLSSAALAVDLVGASIDASLEEHRYEGGEEAGPHSCSQPPTLTEKECGARRKQDGSPCAFCPNGDRRRPNENACVGTRWRRCKSKYESGRKSLGSKNGKGGAMASPPGNPWASAPRSLRTSTPSPARAEPERMASNPHQPLLASEPTNDIFRASGTL